MSILAEGTLLIKTEATLGTAEADIKTKYTWVSVSEKYFLPHGDYIMLYAQGSLV